MAAAATAVVRRRLQLLGQMAKEVLLHITVRTELAASQPLQLRSTHMAGSTWYMQDS
jgi:hypothetical protein